MEFSDTTNNLGILQRCEKYCGFDYGDITGDTDLTDEFVGYCNDAMDEIWHIVFENYTGWVFDDDNQTDLPIASQNLQNSTAKYALPEDALTIRDIEIKQRDDIWRQIYPITEEQISQAEAEDEFRDSDGTPQYYKVIGNTIEIFPAPDYAKTNGIKVYFSREMTDFASDDTTKEPGFAGNYHDAVPTMASVKWRKINTPDDTTLEQLKVDEQRYRQNIATFYNNRWQDNKPPQMMVGDAVKNNM